ncbi:MAG: FAD-binding oxidoreductase [Vulcanimicrobiaceae bacterium]
MTTGVLEPRSVDELAQIVRDTAAENLAIAPVGSGTMLGLGNPAEREDITICTRGLRRVVDYEAEDQVIVVEAGMTLGELHAILAEKRQRLSIDPPGGDAMTIGGMLATNAYGPRALQYGTLKDSIVGIEIVRADGAIARAGGKVVKNVAGFDVSKLMVGSLGTLAIITKAAFRLHPLPETTRTLAFRATPAQIFPFVLALREAQLEPSATAARLDGGAATIDVVFEGFGPGVDAQSAKCEEIAAQMTFESGDANIVMVSGASEASGVEPQRQCGLKATFPPSELSNVAERVNRATIFPTLGVMHVDIRPDDFGGPSTTATLRAAYARDDNGEEHNALSHIQQLRDFFQSLGGTLVIERMPCEWHGKIDAWGTPPPSFSLMQALKDRFDPQRRLNPGRFVGGL